jgi:4-amino-4-deoxy-L-arabinose transferase-like glycosyltransferase
MPKIADSNYRKKNIRLWRFAAGEEAIYAVPFVIAFLSLLLFAYIDQFPYSPLSYDDQGLFQRVAKNLLDYGVFSGSISEDKVFCPIRPPLYPVIIASVWKVTGSESLLPIRIVQGAAFLLSLFILFKTAVLLTSGNRTYGLITAFAAALIPDTAAAAHIILAECLTLFFLSLSALFVLLAASKQKVSYLILLGTTLGLLVLMRPNFLLIPAPFIVYVLGHSARNPRRISAVILSTILPFVITLSPWMMLNKKNKGSFTPTYTVAGASLMVGILEDMPLVLQEVTDDAKKMLIGNYDRSVENKKITELLLSGKAVLSANASFSPELRHLLAAALANFTDHWLIRDHPLSVEIVVSSDRFLKKVAIEWVERHPLQFLSVILKNGETLTLLHQPLIYQEMKGALYVTTFIFKLAIYILFLVGMSIAILNRRYRLAFFPLMIIGYILVTNSLLHAEPRFFIYALWFMTLLIPSCFLAVKKDEVASR